MYDTYNKQGQLSGLAKMCPAQDQWSRVEAYEPFTTVTLSYPTAAWGPGSFCPIDRKTIDIYYSSNKEESYFYLTIGYYVFQRTL